jgi:hypothetical protein
MAVATMRLRNQPYLLDSVFDHRMPPYLHIRRSLVIITPAAARNLSARRSYTSMKTDDGEAPGKSTQNRDQIFSNSFRFHPVLMVLIRIDDVG